ncbi:hypothetical protein Q4I28_004247 [Leishmania naiffi]|uniref:EF-hand domain-containing protein n=1 Tax=Leishmania naiffi TaxID=5678 RepID=A0AAW3BP20_9TRYP
MKAMGTRQLCRRKPRLPHGASTLHSDQTHWRGLSRTTTGAGTSAEAARPATSLTSSLVSVLPSFTLACPRRFFWNPFVSATTGATSAMHGSVAERNAEQLAKRVEKVHHDAGLESERLLGACLDLLGMCSGNAAGSLSSNALDEVARDRIGVLVDVLLHDHHRTPAEQFDLVYTALCLPAAQHHRQVQRSLLVVLRSVVPEALYRVFESVDLFLLQNDEQSLRQHDVLIKFVHALLGELHVPDGLVEEEVLSVYVENMKAMFPVLATCPAWQVVERDAVTIALKAKLFALLSRLCAVLDEDKTGKVKLADLRSTAERVLRKGQASRLLEGAQADKDGKIAYPQLAALLTRPPLKMPAPVQSR